MINLCLIRLSASIYFWIHHKRRSSRAPFVMNSRVLLLMVEKIMLDMYCEDRISCFKKQDMRAIFADILSEQHILCDGHTLHVYAEIIADF